MLKHTLEALLRTHATAFEALWEAPERLPNGLWKWDVRHSMWVERQKVTQPACDPVLCSTRPLRTPNRRVCCSGCGCHVQLVSGAVSRDLRCKTVLCASAAWSVSEGGRAQVLAGVTILFSALIPLGQPPRAHSLGQLAEQYGAQCVAQEDPSVTHVVAQSNGSAKARWAAAHGKHLVSRHW